MIPELKTLIAVAQYGNFSSAAERVGLTQAAVSGHIKRLETRLGFQLFDRSGHSAKLNNNGFRVLGRARTIVRLVDTLGDFEEEAQSHELRVGIIPSVRATIFDPSLALFERRHTRQGVRVISDVSMHLLDQLDTGEIDLAIMVKPPFSLPADVRWTVLTRDPYVLAVPADRVEQDWRRALQTHSLLRYDPLSFGGRHVERFLRGLPFPIAGGQVVAPRAMLDLVAAGAGVALVPQSDMPKTDRLLVRELALLGKTLVREVGVMTMRQSPMHSWVDQFKQCTLEIVGGTGSPEADTPW